MDFEESIRTDEMVRYGPGGRPDRRRGRWKSSRERRGERGGKGKIPLSTAVRVVWGVFLFGLVGLGSLFGKTGNRGTSVNRGARPQVASSSASDGSTVISQAELYNLRG